MVIAVDLGQTLCDVLRQGQDIHRCSAAQALGRIEYGGALDHLIEALQDEDEDVRVDSVEALGAIGDPAAGPALLESLRDDPCGDVKVAAVVALGRLREAGAIPLLRDLVRGRESEAVAWDEEEFLSGGWDDWLDVQVKAVAALGDMVVLDAVPDILAALDDEMGQDLTGAALPALSRLGAPGIEALSRYLESTDGRLRRRVAEALAEAGSEAACAALACVLGDGQAEVRLAAMHALAVRDAADARLAGIFADPSPAVRAAWVGLCGRHWPERLDALLDDPADEVQAATVELFLRDLELPRPEDLTFRLRVKMRGPSEPVATLACRAIAVLAPEEGLADLAEQLGDKACPIELRRAAARELGGLGNEAAIRALTGAVDDDKRQVRVEVISALCRAAVSGQERDLATEVLTGTLAEDKTPEAEAEADSAAEAPARDEAGADLEAEAPTVTETEPGTETETETETETDTEAAETAAPADAAAPESWPKSTLEALTSAGSDERPAAQAPSEVELDEEDLAYLALARVKRGKKHVVLEPPVVVHEDVRRFAARVLGDVRRVEVVRALAAVLDDADLELRRVAADSLARLGEAMGSLAEETIEPLKAAAADQDRDLRLAATRALGCTTAESASVLRNRLKDDDSYVRAAALRALAGLGCLGDEVMVLLSDSYPGVRVAAAEGLATQGGAEAVARLVDFTFSCDGMHRQESAKLLAGLDCDKASERFLETLRDPDRRKDWRIAIDALAELHRAGSPSAAALVA